MIKNVSNAELMENAHNISRKGTLQSNIFSVTPILIKRKKQEKGAQKNDKKYIPKGSKWLLCLNDRIWESCYLLYFLGLSDLCDLSFLEQRFENPKIKQFNAHYKQPTLIASVKLI